MPLVIALFFVAITALWDSRYFPAQKERADLALATVSATSFLAYRQGVVDYVNANPTFTGTVPDVSITFPWGYVRDPRWTNYVQPGGTLYVFEATAHSARSDLMLDQLFRTTFKSPTVGRNSAGHLVGAAGLSGITAPAAVPDGALLMVGK